MPSTASWSELQAQAQTIIKMTRTTPVYIYGKTPVGEIVYKMVANRHDSVTMWDNHRVGDVLADGSAITPAAFETVSEHSMLHGVIVVAYADVQNTQIMRRLRRIGFKNCYDAQHFYTGYIAAKAVDDYTLYKQLNTDPHFEAIDEHIQMYPYEWLLNAGAPLDNEYVVQDLWAARKVFAARPRVHYDIGSLVMGFVCHLLAFEMPVVLIDVRPLDTHGTENLTFVQADATNLDGIADESIESLSALCSIEHFGLGRYGDPVDPDAHLKAFQSVQRVLRPGGDLYISLMAGHECRLEFNAHRIYTPHYVLEKFRDMQLVEFSRATTGGLQKNAPLDIPHGEGGFGLFHFRKPPG